LNLDGWVEWELDELPAEAKDPRQKEEVARPVELPKLEELVR
jgi:hypothetical protein